MAYEQDNQGRAQYQANLAHARDSKVRGILTGDDNRPITPVCKGKRMVHGGAGKSEAPFATSDSPDSGMYGRGAPPPQRQAHQPMMGPIATDPSIPAGGDHGKAYVAKAKQADTGAAKIGAGGFDPEVYRNARIDKAANMQSQKAKAYQGAGGGNIFQYGNN